MAHKNDIILFRSMEQVVSLENSSSSLFWKCFTFFHAYLGSDVCPRVDNQTSDDTIRTTSDIHKAYDYSGPNYSGPVWSHQGSLGTYGLKQKIG